MKRKIKVGIFVDGDFIPSYDGASNRFHYLSRYLAMNGIEVVVFHGYRGWSDISLIKKEPFKTYVFPIENYYNNLELIASIIQSESIDIIQFDNLEPILLQGVPLAELTGVKLVSEMHYVVRNLAKKLGADKSRIKEVEKIEKEVGKSIDHLISLSNEDKPFIEKYMSILPGKISVIPSGVDLKELKYAGPNFKEKNIIFLGNLYFKPNEDAVRVIKDQIYPNLKRQGFRFTIAGDCPSSLKKECSAPGFSFVGTILDLNQLFKNATFALAPIDEGTGMRIKLLNYLAAGIPVLTTDIATNGFSKKDCFIVEDDYSKYAEKITKSLKNKSELINLSKKGYSMIKKNYDWNTIAKQTIDTYKNILAVSKVKRNALRKDVLKNNEPVWLQEAVAKNRFKKIKSNELPNKFSFAVLNGSGGKINTYTVNKIIALEGMPGAGKTTFTEKYLDLNKRVFIPQLHIKDKKLLLKNNLETSKEFLMAEINKTRLINKLGRNHPEIVVDRTFITTLAYCYARSKVNNTPNEYKKLIDFYAKIRNDITYPTHVIYMDVSIEKSLERRSIHSGKEKYQNWFNPLFLKYFRNFYKTELEKILPIKPILVDTSDLVSEETGEKINKIINSL